MTQFVIPMTSGTIRGCRALGPTLFILKDGFDTSVRQAFEEGKAEGGGDSGFGVPSDAAVRAGDGAHVADGSSGAVYSCTC